MAKNNASNWISLSDMMTGLMLIFLLIAILTTAQVVARENERKAVLTEFDLTKEEIYQDLESAFGEKKDDWGIEITRDLIVKFNNPELLFNKDEASLKNEYRIILNEFIPQYLEIVNREKYKDNIKEVRIEGNTAAFTFAHPTYMSTIELSQGRANSVLSYILDHPYFGNLSEKDSDKITYWFSANGLGNGRTLDSSGKFTYISKEKVSPISRRVEFKIVTTSDELIEEIIKKYKNNF